jgi:hypothetical protein
VVVVLGKELLLIVQGLPVVIIIRLMLIRVGILSGKMVYQLVDLPLDKVLL